MACHNFRWKLKLARLKVSCLTNRIHPSTNVWKYKISCHSSKKLKQLLSTYFEWGVRVRDVRYKCLCVCIKFVFVDDKFYISVSREKQNCGRHNEQLKWFLSFYWIVVYSLLFALVWLSGSVWSVQDLLSDKRNGFVIMKVIEQTLLRWRAFWWSNGYRVDLRYLLIRRGLNSYRKVRCNFIQFPSVKRSIIRSNTDSLIARHRISQQRSLFGTLLIYNCNNDCFSSNSG